MNKTLLSIVIVIGVAVAFGTTSSVYAQSSSDQNAIPAAGYGNGTGGGRGAGSRMIQSAAGSQDGLLHDEMMDYFSEKLGISVDDLEVRLAAGETLAQIAYSQGLTVDEIQTLMTDARSQAIDQAVQNGALTQEQADWMNQRGTGMMNGGRGMHGSGQGQFTNPGCPYYQTTP